MMRDSTKPIVSHVAAQAVPTNITSPSAPLISEHNAQGQEDQTPEAESTATPAKNTSQMYTYTSNTMPSSNAYHGGRARATYAQYVGAGDGSPDSLSPNATPANVTPVNHDDADIFFDACEFIGDDINGNKSPSPQMSSWVPFISFRRRAAQSGKYALMALKYIATHELAGVLQPI